MPLPTTPVAPVISTFFIEALLSLGYAFAIGLNGPNLLLAPIYDEISFLKIQPFQIGVYMSAEADSILDHCINDGHHHLPVQPVGFAFPHQC